MYLYLKQQKNAFLVACCAMSLVLFFPSFAHAFFATIGNALMNATAMLTGAAGLLLNYAIEYLVLGMGNLLGYGDENTIGMGFVITEMWTVIRDVCNIAFIFGLIFIGFQTILNVETLNTKKTLVAVIVGALLINFSLFFTQVIIDVSNVFAAELHKQLQITENTIESHSPVQLDDLNYGIAGIFVNNMGLLTFFGTGNNLTNFKVKSDSGEWTYFFMGTIFLLIAAFVFAAGAVLLIIRFVVLTLLMMFSPILFAGMVFPQTEGFAKGLWKKLLQNAFLAPVYLFMLVLTAKFLAGTSKIFTGNFGDAFGPGAKKSSEAVITNFAVVLNFVLAAVLLIAALVIAKQLSAAGADKSISMLKGAGKSAGKFAMRRAGGLTFGTAAVAGRAVGGYTGARVRDSGWVSRNMNKKGIRGLTARALDVSGDKVAKSSFDARRVGGVGKKLGIGEGKKTSYHDRIKAAEKKEKGRAQGLPPDERVFDNTAVEIVDAQGNKRAGTLAELHKEVKSVESEIKQAQQAYAQAQSEQDRGVALSDVRRLQGRMDKLRTDQYKNAEKEAKNIAQASYAASLENRWWTPTRTRSANQAAAKAIRKELGKDPNQRMLDQLETIASKESKSD